MKRKFNLLVVLFIVALLSFALIGVGCKEAEHSSDSNSSDAVEIELDFTADSLEMVIGDKQPLPIQYTVLVDKMPQYSSSQENIVSVSEKGEITAHLVGEATITASYEGKTDTIRVVSGFGDFIPTLRFASDTDEEVELFHEGTVNLATYVYFNGNRYTDHSIEYVVEGDAGTVTDGIFTANSLLEDKTAVVKVSAKWRGFEGATLVKTVTVHAKDRIELYANDGTTEYELYTKAEFYGQKYVNEIDFIVDGMINGKTQIQPSVAIIDGEEYISYNETEQTLSGIKSGQAVIRLSYESVVQDIKITVKPVVGQYKGDTILFSAEDGEFPLEEIFGATDVTLVSAIDFSGTKYPATENRIMGIPVAGDVKPEETTFTVYTDEVGLTVTMIAYSKVIKTVQDLEDAFRLNASPDGTNAGMTKQGAHHVLKTEKKSGYYILLNDITVEPSFVYDVIGEGVSFEHRNTSGGVTEQPLAIWMPAYSSGGLTGTFDGNGHKISGLTVSDYGVFGMVNGGTIKDVCFENVKYTGKYGNFRSTLGYFLFNATLENVYISTERLASTSWNGVGTGIGEANASDARVHRSLVASVMGGNVKMNNCIFVCPEIDATDVEYHYSYGSLCAFDFNAERGAENRFQYQITNTYVVSPYALSVATIPPKSAITMAASKNITFIVDYKDVDLSEYNNATNATVHKSTDFVRYDDNAEMRTANNDYTSFAEHSCWEIVDGLPVWRS